MLVFGGVTLPETKKQKRHLKIGPKFDPQFWKQMIILKKPSIFSGPVQHIPSWWFQPNWKICSSNWIIPPGRGKNKKYLKPPPRFSSKTHQHALSTNPTNPTNQTNGWPKNGAGITQRLEAQVYAICWSLASSKRLQGIHPLKLTCPLKRDYFNRKFMFQPSIFRGYVSFTWCHGIFLAKWNDILFSPTWTFLK